MHDKPGWKRFALSNDVTEAENRLHTISEDGWIVVSVVEDPETGLYSCWARRGY